MDVLGDMKTLFSEEAAKRGISLEKPKRSDRDQAIVDQQLGKSFGEQVMDVVTRPTALGELISGVKPTPLQQEFAELQGQVILDRRKQQRDYVSQADPKLVEKTRSALQYLTDASNRFGTIEALRTFTPEEREEAMRLAPGIMQQLGDDRGNLGSRAVGALGKGINDIVVNPLAEMVGLSLSPEEVQTARYLESLRNQDAAPTRGDDPWYVQGALGAIEQAPYAIGTSRLATLGGNTLKALGAGATVSSVVGQTGGTIAATFPSAYINSYHGLKDMGMQDDWKLKGTAATMAVIAGAIERIDPKVLPEIPGGKINMTQGVGKALGQQFLEAVKKFPKELGEEGAQAFSDEMAKVAVSWANENIEDMDARDAFVAGLDGLDEALLPMLFMTGAPAAASATLSVPQAAAQTRAFDQQTTNATPEYMASVQRELQGLQDAKVKAPERIKELSQLASKGFVSKEDADTFGIGGETRKERIKNVYAELDQLNDTDTDGQIEYLQSMMDRWKEAGNQFPERIEDEVQDQTQAAQDQESEVPNDEGQIEEGVQEVSPLEELKANMEAIQEEREAAAVPPLVDTEIPADPNTAATPAVEPMVEEAELSGEDPAAERKRLRAARQKGAPGGTKASAPIAPGQFVQWTSNGADQFKEPKKVVKAETKDGVDFLQLEGESTWIPAKEATVVPEAAKVPDGPVNPADEPSSAVPPAPQQSQTAAVPDATSPANVQAKSVDTEQEKALRKAAAQETKDWKKRTRRAGGRQAKNEFSDLNAAVKSALGSLNLKVSDDLSPKAIQKAFRKAAAKAHPDAGGSVEQMAALNEASELLSNVPASLELAKRKWEQKQGVKSPPAEKPSVAAEPVVTQSPADSKPEAPNVREQLDSLSDEDLRKRAPQGKKQLKRLGLINAIVEAESKVEPQTGAKPDQTGAKPDQTGAKPDQTGAVRRGKVGDMLSSGEKVLTTSGRETTPFPKVDTGSDRKATNTVKKVDAWLHQNAIDEARSRGDDFNLRQFENEDPKRLPPASKDAMEEYLFGEMIPVVPSILKDMSPKPEAPSEADFDAEAAKALDALDAQEKAPKEKKPKSDGKPRVKRTGRKSDATKAEAQSDREAAKKAMAAAMAKLRGKVMMGVDPTIMAEIVQAAAMYVKADIKSFKGYVEALVEDFGDAWAKDFAPYLESAWRVLHSRGRVEDPAGKIADFLTGEAKNEKQEEPGTERDQRMGDGPGESQGDATATGDPVDGGRDAEGDPGQKGDALLPDSRKTEPDGGQRDGDGASADGDPDADQSDQGPTDATDSESGSDAGEMADRLAVNHVIAPDDDLAVSGVVTSLNRNIKALELLKALETEGRFPDESERKALAQFTGWGGLSQALDSIKGERMLKEQPWGRDENWEKKWGKHYTKLKEILTKEEFQAAQESTENAHYTSKSVIQALWKIAERLGFNGGRVLELGAGVGHFAGLTPGRVRGATQFVMVEMDSISSRITKMLYPKHEVVSGDMQEFKAVPGSVAMGIGNVPFAPGNIPDSKARYGVDLNLHNYSIARHLDAVAPGGIVVVISTHHTLDSQIRQRKFLATKGELIGAIRLPNDAFAENAKTEVVTDILIFRRPRQGDPTIGVRLDQNANITVKTKEGKDVEKSISKYFVDNPDMVLGVHSAKGSMRAADEYTVESTPGDLQKKLDAAINRLPMNILGKVEVSEQIVESTKNVPFGRLEVHNGKVVMGFGDNFVPIAGKTFEGFPSHLTGKTGVERAKDYVNLRESLAQVRKVMLSEDSTDADVKLEQQKLSKLYDSYVKKHGPLNSRKTNIFVRDPDYYRVLSLENEQGKYNPKTKKIDVTYEKSAIFETRVLGPRKEPQTADSTSSAMSLSIAWRGAIDSAFIGKLLGVSASDAENRLIEEGLAFRNPATTELDLADLYLSGNVRMKLAQAKLSAAEDAQYERNVEALTKVLPAEVPIRKDTVRLGATWVPEHIIQAFASKIFGTEASISYNSNSDSWTVNAYGISETAKARYKTDRVNPDKILEETLNLRSIKVYDRVETGEYDSRGKEKTTQVLNEKETQAAKHRASVMRADFEKWVMENEEVRQVLGAIYNDKYNNFVRTKYNGSALALPGANPTIKLRPYQMDAIWRIINRGTALLAHAVGSGKTFTMIGAAMEMRRLGLARRPLLVVQNATLGQFATSFQKMYPNANVLVASKGDLSAGNRQLFLNRVSTGNWDAVVMAQSTFDNMASDPEVERAFINDQVDLLEEAIREEGGEGAKTPTTKQLVRQRKSLKDRFDKLMGKRAKAGDNIVFEDLGADALFLDEAHAYKKPTFMTKLSSLVGLNTESSAKSLATTVKVRSIQAAHNGRNVILATGTPVTNTLGEAWHMVNYVSPATNEAFSSKTFDQFISNFAMVEPTLTMNAGGQYVYKDAIVKFRNGQQLVEYINDNWDIVTPDALRAYMSGKNESLPELRDGKLTAITVDRTPGVSEFMQFIESVYARFKSLPAKERRELSFIPAIAYGASKAATLDIRLVNPNAKEEPNSKLQRAAKEIKRIYDETSETKGAQLFFSDIKNPFSMTRLRQFMGGQVIDAFEEDTVTDGQDADADTQNEVKEEDSFLYQELKRKLLESGIPAEQIALISDAKTDKQRESLFERVQSGDIRVLIGSTSKMGVGVNVQNKLAAIHHFDTPWLPADLEQREGRIIRFGNENKVVEILRYAMKRTLDGAIYMATSRKQKFIWQVLNGQLDGDSFDDPSSAAMLSIEEQLAAIQDDPIFFEKIETQNRLRELELERQSFYDAQQRSRSTLNQYQSSLNYTEESSIPWVNTRIQQFEEYKAAGVFDNFSLTIDGKTFTDTKEATEIIKVKAEEIRKYVMENHDAAKSLSRVAGINDLGKNQIIRFQIGPAEVTIGASPSVTDEINAEGNVVRTKSVSLKSEASIPSGLGRLYPFYSGTAVLPQTIFEKMGPLLEQSKDDLRAELNRVNFYTKSIEELKTLVDRQWEDQAEYDQKKERLGAIEQIMLASKSSLSSETKKEDEGELEKELRNRPPDPETLFQREEPSLMEQATNVVLDAEDLGLTIYDELIAFAVKSIGERQTRFLGKYLQEAAKAGGMKGVRPTKEILGVPGVTKAEVVTFAKAAFKDSPMVTDEMIETGMNLVDITAFGLEKIGWAPAGTPVPSGRMAQGVNAEQFFSDKAFASAGREAEGKSRTKIINMSIDDFLQMAEALDSPTPSKAESVSKVLAEGQKFSDLPYLGFTHDGKGNARVTSHEGRHRAMALKARGVVTIPVRLHSDGANAIRWNQQQKGQFDRIKGEWPKALQGQTSGKIAFPVADPAASVDQANTPAFKKWFGDSKVVDADGKPLVVYHGTNSEKARDGSRGFDAFDPSTMGRRDVGYFGKGFYFSPNPVAGEMYAGYEPGARILPVYLSIQNPYIYERDDRVGPPTVESLREQGHDGIFVMKTWDGKSRMAEIVAFDPTQIKSATGNQGTFDPSNPSILFQTANQRWHSAARKIVEQKMGPKGTSDQVLAMLRKNGAKEEELEWSGLIELLGGKQSVTKAEVLAALDNGVRVEEVIKGGRPSFTEDEIREQAYNDIREVLARDGALSAEVEDAADRWMEDNHDYEAYDILDAALTSNGKPGMGAMLRQAEDHMAGIRKMESKYFAYTLPGAEKDKYFEVLVTLPVSQQGASNQDAIRDKYAQHLFDMNYAELSDSQQSRVDEMASTDARAGGPRAAKNSDVYRSPHYDEPNIVSTFRFTVRTNADGKKVMVLEEVQSDWHQAGRKKGYAQRAQGLSDYPITESNGTFWLNYPDGDETPHLTRENAENERDRMLRNRAGDMVGVPDAPFKKTWPMLAMKRAIQWAAENGIDRIAWTTGEQQAERYDLSKQVDSIQWSEKHQRLVASRMGRAVIDEKGVTSDKLEDFIGKEAAKKLLEQPDVPFQWASGSGKALDGDNLKVGGEGMKAFYDKMLPNEVNKFIKKFGAKVGQTQLGAAAKWHVHNRNYGFEPTGYVNPPREFSNRDAADSFIGNLTVATSTGRWVIFDENMEIVTGDDLGINDAIEFRSERGARDFLSQLSPFAGENAPQLNQPGFDITPAMRESALSQGQPLFQRQDDPNGNVKGWTKFVSATRAIIGATDKADFSTFIHEFFHPMRRFLLDRSVPLDKRKGITDEDLLALEKYAGVEDGDWEFKGIKDPKARMKAAVAAEEKAAKAWEQYWLEGKSPTEALRILFEKVARWMMGIYKGVQQITGDELPPEVRRLFDKIVQRGFPDGFQVPPPHQGPGAPPVGSESHPEKLERIFPSRYEYTAMGKGVMNYLRELSNVPGLESNTKETVEGWVQQAEVTLAADPYAAERLYRDVAASGGRPLDQHEVTLLAFHYRKLANDSDAAFQETVAAAESGDPVRIAQARTDFIRTRQPMTEFEELTYASKSAMGRAFFALQVMLRQDFTPGGLMKRAQQANHGKPLNDAQRDEMQALADQVDKLQKEVDRLRAKYDREEAETESKKQDDQARKDTKPRPKASPAQKTTLETAWDAFKSFTGIDTLFQQDGPYGGIAQAYRDMGVTTFAELMRHVQERIGKAKAKELKAEFRTAWKSTEPDADLTGAFDRGNDRDMTKLARQIQRQLIEGGFTDRLEVIEAVREEMSGLLESEVTTIQAMDWLSGYGQYSTPSQGEVDKLIRQHNGETLKHRQIIQLGDALARAEQLRTANPDMTDEQIGDQLVAEGLMVKPTGPQRDQAWPELRKLQREYNDLKSEVPVSSEGRAGMLQTRLGTIQRGLANRIVDLKEAIAKKERINNERKPSPSNDETDRLREELAGLTKTYREMFPKKPMTEEQRIKNAIKAAERSIADMEKQIATHNFDKPKSMKVSSPELDKLEAQKSAMRAQIDALKALELSQWENEGGALGPDKREAAIRKNYIASMERRIAEYHRILAEKDFKKKVKVDRKLTDEELKAQNRLREARQKTLEAMAKYHVANLKGLAKVLDTAAEIGHLSRAMMTSLDLSALLNQGALMALSRPVRATRVLRDVARVLQSQFDRGKLLNRENLSLEKIEDFLTGIDTRQAEFNHMNMLTSGEVGEFKIKAGLALTSSDQELTKQEEAFQGRWGKYWPGVAISGRVYVMMLNGLRSSLFDALANGIVIGGRQMTLEEGKLLASFVNVTTGRSDLKDVPFLRQLEKHSAALNSVFFAARYVASRFQYLAMPFYLPFAGGGVSKAWNVKGAIYLEMARTTGSYMAVLGAVSLLSTMFWDDDDEDRPTIGTDPTTSDFGKVKFGDTRIDFGGGILQSMVFMSRFGLGRQGDTQFGEGYQPMTRAKLTGNFIRTKLAPVPGFIWTGLSDWKDPVGNVQDELLGFKVHPSIGTGARLFVPLTMQNMYDVTADHGLAGLPLAAMSFLGVRISTYGPKTKYTYSTPDEREKQLDDYVKYMTWDSPDPEFKEFLTPEEFEQVQLRRESRKQALVNDALHDPQLSDFDSQESYEKAVAKRDKAIEAAKEAGWSAAEIRQLLLDHWKSNNGSPRHLRGGVYVLKDQVRARIRRINKVFGGVPGAE